MKTNIELLGTSFILHSDQESEYIDTLLAYIKEQLAVIRHDVDCKDPLKASIMASLLITHELFALRDSMQQERIETSNTARKLSLALDSALVE